jgi:hypothetical protein
MFYILTFENEKVYLEREFKNEKELFAYFAVSSRYDSFVKRQRLVSTDVQPLTQTGATTYAHPCRDLQLIDDQNRILDIRDYRNAIDDYIASDPDFLKRPSVPDWLAYLRMKNKCKQGRSHKKHYFYKGFARYNSSTAFLSKPCVIDISEDDTGHLVSIPSIKCDRTHIRNFYEEKWGSNENNWKSAKAAKQYVRHARSKKFRQSHIRDYKYTHDEPFTDEYEEEYAV